MCAGREGGADPSKLNREAGHEEIDPHPKLTNLPTRGGKSQGAAEKGRGGTGPGRCQKDPTASRIAEDRRLWEAADPARGRRRAPWEAELG